MADEETTTPDPNEGVIAALERERGGYIAAGKDDRVKQVDAELKRLSGKRAKRGQSPDE